MPKISELFGGSQGGGNTDKMWLYFRTSRTWTVPFDMEAVIHAIGAGGRGGIARYATSGWVLATGAGGPGYVRKRVSLKEGQVLNIAVGAQTPLLQYPGLTTQIILDGMDGGDTTISSDGIEIFAGGGKGGKAAHWPPNTATAQLLGGAGGLASGGDFNAPGGRGGNIAGQSGSTSGARATGAGGVDILGLGPFRGGDLTAVIATGTSLWQATGGAGISSNGDDSSATTGMNGTLGGWAGQDVFSAVGALNQLASIDLPFDRSLLGFLKTLGPIPVVSGTGSPGPSGPGGGGTGAATSASTTPTAGQGGVFAGSGGVANAGTAQITNGNTQSGTDMRWGMSIGGAAVTGGAVVNMYPSGPGLVALELFV